MDQSNESTSKLRPSERAQHSRFIESLYPHVPPGVIELRLVGNVGDLRDPERRWYPSGAAYCDDVDSILDHAETAKLHVYAGVLPRRAQGHGKASDVLAGFAAWLDLDFKDYGGDEAKARAALDLFPIKPTYIVRTGHGLHAYWILRESAGPAEISALCKRLEVALGGDHVSDPARIMRMPFSVNYKAEPVRSSFEVHEPERVYNLSELNDALDMIEEPFVGTPPPSEESESASDSEPEDESDSEFDVSPRIRALLHSDRRIRSLFEGTGKTELDEKGKRLDTSRSGYDFSFALALAKKNVSATEIEGALRCRPNAKSRDEKYVKRTVARAINLLKQLNADAAKSAAGSADFEVEKVQVFKSEPRLYYLTIEGKTIEFRSHELLDRKSFALMFFEAFGRIPALPDDGWAELINSWIASAEFVDAPPEASDEASLRHAISLAIADLPNGEGLEDLDHSKAIKLQDGRTAFRAEALLRGLKDNWPQLKRGKICKVLGLIGYASETHTIGGGKVRVWVKS